MFSNIKVGDTVLYPFSHGLGRSETRFYTPVEVSMTTTTLFTLEGNSPRFKKVDGGCMGSPHHKTPIPYEEGLDESAAAKAYDAALEVKRNLCNMLETISTRASRVVVSRNGANHGRIAKALRLAVALRLTVDMNYIIEEINN